MIKKIKLFFIIIKRRWYVSKINFEEFDRSLSLKIDKTYSDEDEIRKKNE